MSNTFTAAAALGAVAAASLALSLTARPSAAPSLPQRNSADRAVPAELAALGIPERYILRPGAPMAACLAPDAELTLEQRLAMDAYLAGIDSDVERYGAYNGWGPAGVPRVITWSIVPDGTDMSYFTDKSVKSDTFAKFDAVWPRQQWIGIIEDCFDRWGELTGITFQRVTVNGQPWDDGARVSSGNAGSSTRGDIRIGAGNIDGPGGYLGLGFYPSTGDQMIDSSEMTRWSNPVGDYRGLRNAVMHELGHNLGAAHVVSPTHRFLMEPWIDGSYYGPQHDDIRFGHYRYGDAFEPNDTTNTSANLGSIGPGQYARAGAIVAEPVSGSSSASIHKPDDADFYEIDVAGPTDVTIVLQPLGFYHENGPQSGPATGSDSSRGANLLLDIGGSKGSQGTRVNTAGLGAPETYTVSVGSGVTTISLAVRSSTFSDVQLYDLVVSAGGLCAADLNTANIGPGDAEWGVPDGQVDGADVSYFIELWLALDPSADLSTEHANPGEQNWGVPDGEITGSDLSYFIELWLEGCV